MHVKQLSDIEKARELDRLMSACEESKENLKQFILDLTGTHTGPVFDTILKCALDIERELIHKIGRATVAKVDQP